MTITKQLYDFCFCLCHKSVKDTASIFLALTLSPSKKQYEPSFLIIKSVVYNISTFPSAARKLKIKLMSKYSNHLTVSLFISSLLFNFFLPSENMCVRVFFGKLKEKQSVKVLLERGKI
jgi:hypothetical protein